MYIPRLIKSSLLDKMAAILQTAISNAISSMQNLYFGANFTEVCPWGTNWQKVSIGSGNGLAPNRRQAITRTNVDPVHGRIYAALGGAKVIPFHQRPQAKCDNFLSTSLLSAVSWPFYYSWTIIRPFHENQYASRTKHSTKLAVK